MWSMDATGRVLISPELRQAAGISKDAMLLGMGNHFELWDKATYDAQEAQAMQGDMPDVFKDFSFLRRGGPPRHGNTPPSCWTKQSMRSGRRGPRLRHLGGRHLWAWRPFAPDPVAAGAPGAPGGLRQGPRSHAEAARIRMRVFPFGTKVFAIWPSCRRAARRAC
jgi:hypothetical protein